MTDFEKELNQFDPPAPSPQAKRRAISAAMQAFETAQSRSQTAQSSSQTAQSNLETAQSASQTAVPETAQTKKSKINSPLLQGLLFWRRPTDKQNIRSNIMSRLTQRSFTMGLASACVLTFGLVLVFPLFWQRSDEQIIVDNSVQVPSVTIKEKAETKTADVAEYEMAAPPSAALEEVVVTGMRSSAAESAKLSKKPAASQRQVSAIRAQDIGALSDQSNAAALQRIAGVPVDGDTIVAPAPQGNDKFEHVEENSVKSVAEAPVSTFSIDVDTASYSFVRRQLNSGYLPEKDAIRAEEIINYFDYNYPLPSDSSAPFKPNITVMDSPWAKGKKLVHIGLKGYDIAPNQKPRTNLVFLLDVSGSMSSQDKLPLVKQSMEMLLSTLNPDDTVAIVVYAGAAGTVLEPTPAKDKQKILSAMQRLQAGGSTAGGAGIALAYDLAEANFDKKAVNRVILATDGDFNVGSTNNETLQGFVERKREKGIFLSVLGFGQGNYSDHLMQTLAQNGNGVAAYIDTVSEAQKVLVQEASSSLFPIAKDVKIQVEFNPATVAEYRLIGYETRALNREDFNNDAVDAGDIGAGHTVTAIYEITPVGSSAVLIDESRYAQKAKAKAPTNAEYGFFKLRYKLPSEDTSRLIEAPILQQQSPVPAELMQEVNFSVAVAAYAQKLKGSNFLNKYSYHDIIALAQANKGSDEYGYRTEFVQLVRKAELADDLLR